ncbi:MAG: DHH family phosphoesterase [Candidatus Hodarchaeales archaeon]|jgi:phosphoesterase RecJ-like protein
MKNKIHRKITNDFVNKVNSKFKEAKSIAITSHVFPDDDSIASVMAVYYYLTKKLIVNANVNILYTGKSPNRWKKWSQFKNFKFVEDVESHLAKHDLLIILDGSGWKRFSYQENVRKYRGTTICIDHHPKPADTFNYHIIGNQYSSTCEVIYEMFFKKSKLSKEICEILLMGIYGDTGHFTFMKSGRTQVFKVAARLINEGDIDMEQLLSKYSGLSWRVFQVFSELVTNTERMEVDGWPKFIISTISRELQRKNKYTDNEMNEARQHYYTYLKSMDNYTWGFIAIPLKTGVKVSGRSRPGSVSLRDIMERLEIGGGHNQAASGVIKVKDVDKAINYVIDWIKKNKPLIV